MFSSGDYILIIESSLLPACPAHTPIPALSLFAVEHRLQGGGGEHYFGMAKLGLNRIKSISHFIQSRTRVVLVSCELKVPKRLPAVKWKLQNIGRIPKDKHIQALAKLEAVLAEWIR